MNPSLRICNSHHLFFYSSIRNNQKTKHLTHLLDGDVFDRKSKAAGFNRYFFNQNSINELSADNSALASPSLKKPATSYSGGDRVLNQLNKPLAVNKNSYVYSTDNASNNNMPIIPIILPNNREIVNRDIYSISDSYENSADVNYAKVNVGFVDNRPAETNLTEPASGNVDNFENLYSQVKKPSTRNPSLRNDQALYMNTFYNS